MNAILGINVHILHETDYEKRRKMQLERLRLRSRSVFQLPDFKFRRMFRMEKQTFAELMHVLIPHLREPLRSDGISREIKVASTLRFLAQGSYQMSVGRDFSFALSQPSISKALRKVVAVMNTVLCPRYIQFPSSDAARDEIKTWFLQEFGIPNIIGVIDGTQIGIYPPFITCAGHPEHVYVNRKNFHSINVQLIVDHRYRILNVNAKFPGSTHDSHIWRMSAAREYLSNIYRHHHEWILGDSGYPLEPWLMTPIDDPQTADDIIFNNLHSKAHCVVERAIGLLKAQWRCLCKQQMLHYAPTTARRIINACAALHNFCAVHFDDFDEPYEPEVDTDQDVVYGIHNTLADVGNVNRQEIIQFVRHLI